VTSTGIFARSLYVGMTTSAVGLIREASRT